MALKPLIKWIGSPNFGYPRGTPGRSPIRRPVAIVCHRAEGSITATDDWFSNPSSEVATHFAISFQGVIHQYVYSNNAAWGNGTLGEPSAEIVKAYPDINPNLYTVSCEFEGFHFQALSPEQVESAIALFRYLCDYWSIPVDRKHIIGHYEIDRINRSNCPGPRFPFDALIEGTK